MPKSRSYGVPITLLILLLAAGGGWYYWHEQSQKAPDFYTSKVSRGELIQSVTATGVLKPIKDILVSSQISGYINTLLVDFNDEVKKDQLLATLRPETYESAVASATADLASAKANFMLQDVNVTRDKELLAKQLIPQSDYDQAVAQREQAQAQMSIKQAALDTAKTNLGYCRILSPIDGIVIGRSVDEGNSVSASLSSPTLFEIGNDLTQMQIDASVAEADIGNVQNGQAVNFTVDAYPNRQFHGEVYQVRNAPVTVQNVVTYDVMIKVGNDDLKLKPGMTATASIVIATRENALRIANSALRFRMPDNVPGVAKEAAKTATRAGGAAKPMSSDDSRKALRQIMQEVGYTGGRGAPPPSADVIQRMQQLGKERGVEIPDRMLGGGNRPAGAEAAVSRNVYVQHDGTPPPPPESVRVRLGISDGTDTEVLEGLKEGDVVITGINQPMASPSAPTQNPFGGGGNRGGGRGF